MLEVTEGVFIADLTAVVTKMEQLRKQGIRFSIDDFGTGYSSLQYLKRLPIQELKIDKSFIDGLPSDLEDIALVKTIVGIAQNLELLIVIEGVETLAQVELLNTMGDFVMQGYYYAKPQPAEEIIQKVFSTGLFQDV
jgi:EAL domain-containing protein (putative c-di-GMP-specific phosphodiesterase class I)